MFAGRRVLRLTRDTGVVMEGLIERKEGLLGASWTDRRRAAVGYVCNECTGSWKQKFLRMRITAREGNVVTGEVRVVTCPEYVSVVVAVGGESRTCAIM